MFVGNIASASKSTYIIMLLLFVAVSNAASFSGDTSSVDLRRKNDIRPLIDIKKDSIQAEQSQKDEITKPGKRSGENPNPYQDSAYVRAMRIRIPASVRLENDMKVLAYKYADYKNQEDISSWAAAVRNLDLPSKVYSPTAVEAVQRRLMIENSQYVPFLNTVPRPGVGVSMSLSSIGRFLGVIEDVTPEIKFAVYGTEEVDVTVYSIQASAVCTIFHGELKSGDYKYVWNFRDDKGRQVPAGDYVAEVKIGKSRYFRKRIVRP